MISRDMSKFGYRRGSDVWARIDRRVPRRRASIRYVPTLRDWYLGRVQQ